MAQHGALGKTSSRPFVGIRGAIEPPDFCSLPQLPGRPFVQFGVDYKWNIVRTAQMRANGQAFSQDEGFQFASI